MSTLALRQRLIDIARLDMGKLETSPNQSPTIAKYWPATNYPSGFRDRAPYCAAAMCYWVREWLKDTDVLDALKMTADQAEKWRCKSARAFDWTTWAKAKGLIVMSDAVGNVLHTGDIMVFDMSHIGAVVTDYSNMVSTLEANTGAGGGRDGEGNFPKQRPRAVARDFIRLLS